MNWKSFSDLVSENRYSNMASSQGKIAELLCNKGGTQEISQTPHKWYPRGISDSENYRGYRYVDMNHSFYGKEPVLMAEASCCIIVVLVDRESRQLFCAHISAVNDYRYKAWYLMKFDLQSFFYNIKKNLKRAELLLFSNNLFKGKDGTLEQRAFLKLFSYVFNQQQLHQLAENTYFIEGENGKCWNPFCAVRLNPEANNNFINVYFG